MVSARRHACAGKHVHSQLPDGARRELPLDGLPKREVHTTTAALHACGSLSPRRRPPPPQPKRAARPFIPKADAESFNVVHRSQQDPKYYDEGASKHVLLSTGAPKALPLGMGGSVVSGARSARSGTGDLNDRGTVASGLQSVRSKRSRAASVLSTRSSVLVRRVGARSELSEVDGQGLPLDGYDYSRHLTEGGQGTFVSAGGSVLRGGSSVASGRSAASARSARSGRTGRGGGMLDTLSEMDEGDGASVDGVEDAREAMMESLIKGIDDTIAAGARLGLPEDVLPSAFEDELPRVLDALTLLPERMNPELRRALADVEDDDAGLDLAALEAELEEETSGADGAPARRAVYAKSGRDGWEELDDDFVMQAMGKGGDAEGQEGEDGEDIADAEGFDFDAHVARLMALAEGQMVDADDLDDEGAYPGEEEEEEEEEGEGDEGSAGPVRFELQPRGGVGRASDAMLRSMLASYDDEYLGALDDDPRLRVGDWAGGVAKDEEEDGEAGDGGPEAEEDKGHGGYVYQEGEEVEEEDEEEEVPMQGHRASQRAQTSILQYLQPAAAPKSGKKDDDSEEDYEDGHIDEVGRTEALAAGVVDPWGRPVKALAFGAALAEWERENESREVESLQMAAKQARTRMREREKDERAAARRRAEVAHAVARGEPVELTPEEEEAAEQAEALAAAEASAPAAATAQAVAATTSGFSVKIGLFAPKRVEAAAAPPAQGAGEAAASASESNKPVPFGCAEGDMEMDPLHFFPASWSGVKPRARWDAETILSTLTAAEHHPRRLVENNRPRAAASEAASVAGSVAGSVTGSVSGIAPLIRLSRKSGLPVGFTRGAGGALVRMSVQAARTVEEDEEAVQAARTVEEDEEETSGSSSDGSGSEEECGTQAPSTVRRPDETAEEKRERKAAVKAGRRAARASKKALKGAFGLEERRVGGQMRAKDSPADGRGIVIRG